MKEFFKDIASDKITRFSFWLSLLFLVLGFAISLFSYRSLPPFIPIFNQLPWGEQRISETITIFIPLIISFAINVTNLFLAAFLYKKIPLISRILAVTSLILTILVFLFITKIILLIL